MFTIMYGESMESKFVLPVIDMAPIWEDYDKGIEIVAKQVREAYTTIGFAYVINHQVPQDIIDKTFEASKEFHALSLEDKIKIKQNDCFRGYVPLKASQLKVSTEGVAKQPNQLEAFVMAFDVPTDHPDYATGDYLAGPNQWPEALPSLKPTMEAYREELLRVANTMYKVFSVAMGMPADSLDHLFKEPSFFQRLQYYPEQPAVIPDDVFGIAPHTDYGFCTFVAQSEVEGLEVRLQDGRWIKVPYIPGTFILNSGDMLKRMSNDTFLSTPHRVVNHSGKARYSIPFFFEPNMHAYVKVLDSCTKTEKAKYPEIMYGEYLMDRIQGNYNLGKRPKLSPTA